MTAAAVRVSYIVLSRNSARFLPNCLDSLSRDPGDDVWVVDNGSVDDSRAILESYQRDYGDRFHLVLLPENVGTTVSRNIALRECRGSFIGIVDSDVAMPPEAVDAMLRWFPASPRCGIVAPRLSRADGSFQLSTDVFPTLSRKIHRALRLKSLERNAASLASSSPRTVDYAISACWLMPRRVVQEVGLLDEEIFYSPEDADYCVRVWKAGYQIVYDPRIDVLHDAQEISRRPGRAAWLHAKGLLYYFRKHGCLLSASGIRREVREKYGDGLFTVAVV